MPVEPYDFIFTLDIVLFSVLNYTKKDRRKRVEKLPRTLHVYSVYCVCVCVYEQ